MNDDPHADAIARIDRALVRIERAAQSQAFENHTLAARHAALRTRIGDAIGALDSVIARETETD
ncbi:hypothetical protein [Sphingomonas sp. Leaf10]|jgi:hypothetical protein|uniref:hypothetical protein n=1 Tax=Sphingomonas sp. Leaf10 TaxID=1735676 RepID=UPI000701FAA9|nr:hypothetical protein [Sphingomonas sp. Leaf10]KQM41444.1 hypothetical protein ASE59_04070 [Sphingomonas sp. Leaf10]